MLTIHAADQVRVTWDSVPVEDGAVAVEGSRIAAVGPLAELAERFPAARVRRWPGVLGPARLVFPPCARDDEPRQLELRRERVGRHVVPLHHQAVPLAQ